MFMFLVFSVDHENYDFGLNFAVYQYHFIEQCSDRTYSTMLYFDRSPNSRLSVEEAKFLN